MNSRPVSTYLRFIRRRSGITQKQLAEFLGTVTSSQVSRHERSAGPPNLLTAFGYQVIFRRPVSEIFPGLYHAVEAAVEERLAELEEELGKSALRGRAAAGVARQLEWLAERRDSEINEK